MYFLLYMCSYILLCCVQCRINFTLEDLAPVCPAYNYFMKCLERTYFSDSKSEVAISFKAEQLPTEFGQHLEYERVKELVSGEGIV